MDIEELEKRKSEGIAYIRSMMAAWAVDYELNAKGEIVKKNKDASQNNQSKTKK